MSAGCWACGCSGSSIVSSGELIVGGALALILVILAGFFGIRQLKMLRILQSNPLMPEEERRFHSAQVKRRLWSSALMLLFAESRVSIGVSSAES